MKVNVELGISQVCDPARTGSRDRKFVDLSTEQRQEPHSETISEQSLEDCIPASSMYTEKIK